MFERFLKHSNLLLCIADKDGRIGHISDAFVELLGYSRDQLLESNLMDFVHPADLEKTKQELSLLLSGTITPDFENRYVTKNGRTVILIWTKNIDPETNQMFATAQDVTAERLVMNQYSQVYDAFLDNIIFVRTCPEGTITNVNENFCEVSGYARQELIGNTHRVVNSGVHEEAFFKGLWNTIASGKVWTGVIVNRKKSGELYYVQSVITPIKDLNGKIESYVAMRQDITERVEYKQESEKTLSVLNETSSIAKIGGWELEVATGQLIWTDETFKILDVKKVKGQSPILPEGLQLFIDDHVPIIDKAVSDAIEYGKPYSLELQAKTPKGDVKWVYTTGHANYTDGNVVSLSGIIQDIDERKKAEITLNRERQKNIQASKFAALGELSASIAHEINNPLGVISGYAELLKFQRDDDASDKLDAIIKSCDRIAQIVKNLKRFSRTDEAPVKSQLELTAIIDEALVLVNPRIKNALIKLSSTVEENLFVWGNHVEIEQVIINLINNAIDAVEAQNMKWIKVTTKKNIDSVCLMIEDSGGGISEQVQERMFSPFFTTKNINKGTGLGLSIVKGILDNHGCDIEFENTDLGARFTITFPALITGTAQWQC